MIEIPYKTDILNASTSSGVPASLIAAIIKIESDFDAQAYRAEPSKNDASYGLMQILSGTAKMVMGTTITAEELYNPSKNIIIGTKYLQQLYAKYNDIDDTISAYNHGRPYRNSTNVPYTNQKYVDNVNWWRKIFSYLIPYGDYAVPTVLLVGGLLTILWEIYAKRR